MSRVGLRLSIAFLVAVTAWSQSAKASITFSLDPDGAGGGSGFIADIMTLDWNPNSALSKQGLTAVRNFILGVGPTTFTTYTHGKLGTALDSNGDNQLPGGVGEITFVAGVSERVLSASVNLITGVVSATFGFNPLGAVNFFEVYQGLSNADPLAGTGYNDGTLILRGTTEGFQGVASYTEGPPVDLLDKVGPNNYPTIRTLTGNGSSSILGEIDFVNPLYFSGLTAGTTLSIFTTQQKNPFTSVNPSARFAELPGGIAPILDGAGHPLGLSLGPVNGSPAGIAPDIQFQTDASSTFDAIVPEAQSIVIWSVTSVGGVLAFAWRRRAQAS